jgi:transcriptional regulator with XRE-family HTH domain
MFGYRMTYPIYIREKARQLRRDKKMTIDELAECLAIPRTTIYYWVRDMPIPTTARQVANAHRGRRLGNRRMRDKYRQLREAAYDEALIDYVRLIEQPGFRDFVCMYIGEGYKRRRNDVQIANSDPLVVKLGDYWIRRLSRRPVTYAVQHHADQDPGELRRFWATELGTDPDLIKVQRKSNSNGLSGRKWRSEHGVLQVRTSDTYLRAELQAWMDCVQGEWLDSIAPGA